MVAEAAPGFAGGEIDDDDAIGAAVGGVGDEAHARWTALEVEADVIEIGGGENGGIAAEVDGLGELVGSEIDADEFCGAGDDGLEVNASGIDDPEAIFVVDDDALDRNQ